MFWQMVNIEHSKIFKRAILWIELALLALIVIAINGIMFAVLKGGSAGADSGIEQILTWPDAFIASLSISAGPNLGGLMIIVLVGALVAQEYTWGTLQMWISRGVPRPLFLGAKFAAVLLPALLIVLTPLVIGGLVSAVFSLILLGGIPFGQVAWGQLGLDTILYTYSLLPYAALAFLLAVASRSTVVSIGGGLAYVLLLEGIALQLIGSVLGGIWAQIGTYLPGGLAKGLLSLNSGLTVQVGDGPGPVTPFLEPGYAALGIGLYVVVLVAVAILIFRRQDLNV
jgi:ABC-type transport system involved in multi-copper enzyme maturation permease subunit